MPQAKGIRDFDWAMFAVVLAICGLGVLQIYSATLDTGFQGSWWKQVFYIAAGIGMMAVVAKLDYHALIARAWPMYLVTVVFLFVVLLIGKRTFGSTRWIGLPGGFRLQVSEFAKIAIVLFVARYLSDLRSDVLEIRDALKLAGLVLVPMALIAKEPDLGTALTYVPILAGGVLIAGLRWKYWAMLGLIAAVVLPLAFTSLQPYQKARIVSFLDPGRDPQGTGYQLIQSKIAVGSGGTWGKGVTKGTQTHLRFLPVPHTHFIFPPFSHKH